MRRVLVPALSLTLFAAAPATVHAATDFTGTYSATDSQLTIYLQNTGDTTIRWWAFRLEGGGGHTGPSGMSADKPGNFTPFDSYNFDFYPDTATARPAIAAGGSLVIQVATNGLVTKLVSSATDTRPEDGGMLPQDTEIHRGSGPPTSVNPPPPDKEEDPPPPIEEDPEELGDGECVLRSARLAVRSLRSQHPCPTSPDPTPSAPCHCDDLELKPKSFHVDPGADAFNVRFGIDWKLVCAGSGGKKCAGTFEVIPPRSPRDNQGLSYSLQRPKKRVECKRRGGCKTTKGHELVRLRITKNKDYKKRKKQKPLPHLIANNPDNADRPQVLNFTITRTCDGEPLLPNRFVQVVFDKKAKLDKKASDLNGNGNPDGTERTG